MNHLSPPPHVPGTHSPLSRSSLLTAHPASRPLGSIPGSRWQRDLFKTQSGSCHPLRGQPWSCAGCYLMPFSLPPPTPDSWVSAGSLDAPLSPLPVPPHPGEPELILQLRRNRLAGVPLLHLLRETCLFFLRELISVRNHTLFKCAFLINVCLSSRL